MRAVRPAARFLRENQLVLESERSELLSRDPHVGALRLGGLRVRPLEQGVTAQCDDDPHAFLL